MPAVQLEPHVVRVLYVDDYEMDRELVRAALKANGGFELTEAVSREQFAACLADGSYDVVISDFNMFGFDGLQAIDLVHEISPGVPIIIVTGTGSEEIAVEAWKRGAADYVLKTAEHIRRLPVTIRSALEKVALERERRQVQEQLARDEWLYRRAIEAAGAVPYYRDYTSGAFQFVGSGIEELTGYPPEQFTPELWESLVEEVVLLGEREGMDLEDAERRARTERGKQLTADLRIRTRSGEPRWLNDASVHVFDDDCELSVGSMGMLADITGRKRMEERLRESEARLAEAQGIASIGCWEVDLASGEVTWSDELYRIMQVEPGTPLDVDMAIREFTHPDDLARGQEAFRNAIATGELPPLEFRAITRAGEARVLWSRGKVVRNPQGEPVKFVGVNQDVTERKRSEGMLRESHDQLRNAIDELKRTQEQVIRQERLSALGAMAAGIGHDLNNTLSPVLGYSEMLREQPGLSEKVREYVKWIETGARDAAAVVARLRQFHGADVSVEKHVSVQTGELLSEVVELTRRKWRDEVQRTGRTIDLDLELEDAPPALGNPVELREVLTNLIFNAVDALPEDGRITLSLRGTPEAVVIEVADTGIGMPADIRARCLEPFFSTKGRHGTGLGLSVCHGIVQRHGGRIEIDSTPGQGTTIRLHLPAAVEFQSDEPHQVEVPLPSGRVLYMDDDPRLRSVIGAMLNRLGQKVDVAESGAEGLEMFRANEYDIVVTDLGMPHMDGTLVTRIVKTARPEMPVVMITGWSPALRSQQPSAAPDFVLTKPVTIRQLREVLERALVSWGQSVDSD